MRQIMDAMQTEYDPVNLHLPDRELMHSGHFGCPGCGAAFGMRLALKALGEKTIMVVAAGCWGTLNGPYPFASLKVPVLEVAFAAAAGSAAGIRAGLDVQGKHDVNVVAWAGDGATFDIGIAALSGAVERNDDIIYVCYDNEAYMNTGIQRSSATPYAAWTTTTPADSPKLEPKKDMVGILAEHRIPYAATASIAYPEDFVRKLNKAKAIRGAKFIHLWVSCPTGHKSEERYSIKIARLAVESGVFPLYEVEQGVEYTVNHEPAFTEVTEYLNLQGRFRHLDAAQIDVIRRNLDWEWKRLRAKVAMGRELLRQAGSR
jgi:pyruvate ferredoxin oxidoreductase beta subunit/2-oxoisovalerate ferredoxin oxidoreductase beta subunit